MLTTICVMCGTMHYSALSQKQHGFSKGKSRLTNLLETFEDITDSLDRGDGVDDCGLP